MPLSLPTDTQHIRFEARQYELMNRPLGQGIVRTKLWVALVVCAVWLPLLWVAGVSPLSSVGPMVYVLPPFVIVWFGTRTDESGRMAMMGWYDAALARLPGRRRVLGNPLVEVGEYLSEPIVIAVETRLEPGAGNGSVSSGQRHGGEG